MLFTFFRLYEWYQIAQNTTDGENIDQILLLLAMKNKKIPPPKEKTYNLLNSGKWYILLNYLWS